MTEQAEARAMIGGLMVIDPAQVIKALMLAIEAVQERVDAESERLNRLSKEHPELRINGAPGRVHCPEAPLVHLLSFMPSSPKKEAHD